MTRGAPGELDGNLFTSNALGYQIRFPEGWNVDEGIVVTPEFSIDAFISPEEIDGVQPNINVKCDQSAVPDEFLDAKRTFARQFAVNNVDEQELRLAGEPAIQIRYSQIIGEKTVEKIETHMFYGVCGWSLTLTQPAGANFEPQFGEALDSFTFIESA